MSDITPKPGMNVLPEDLKQFKEEVEHLLEKGWKQIDMAELLGKDPTNFNHCLSGRHAVTQDLITDLRYRFQHILKGRKATPASVEKPNITEYDTEYISFEDNVEKELAAIKKETENTNATQKWLKKALEEALKKLDALEKLYKAKRKPPESPSGKEKKTEKD